MKTLHAIIAFIYTAIFAFLSFIFGYPSMWLTTAVSLAWAISALTFRQGYRFSWIACFLSLGYLAFLPLWTNVERLWRIFQEGGFQSEDGVGPLLPFFLSLIYENVLFIPLFLILFWLFCARKRTARN